ncbi:MAG: thioredoxin domain-containing protein [Candidatus Gracilibacteria bacterium]|jgi:protein-disulfide isomerase
MLNSRVKFWTFSLLFIAFSAYISGSLAVTKSETLLSSALSPSDNIQGDPQAKVILIEYSDFQCPACANYAPMVRDIVEEFKAHMAFSYRNYPLESIHKNSLPSAYAAQASAEQGKFWEMHDMLFENQNQWDSLDDPKETFVSYAKTLSLDIEKFKQDFESSKTRNKVKNDLNSAKDMKLQSTPSFFLNGQLINNPRSYEQFRTLIREAIK